MLNELDRIVLTEPLPAERLVTGDVGTIVHLYEDGAAFEIEFLTLDGQTAVVATVEASKVRPVRSDEITHAREFV